MCSARRTLSAMEKGASSLAAETAPDFPEQLEQRPVFERSSERLVANLLLALVEWVVE